jgi:hypothetical protein
MSADEFRAIKGKAKVGRAPGETRRGEMNFTEEAYAERLELLKIAGDVLAWDFHAINFRIGDRAWFQPDFIIVGGDLSIHVVEVKGGFVREAGLVRFRAAARQYPMLQWRLVRGEKKRGEYIFEIIEEW